MRGPSLTIKIAALATVIAQNLTDEELTLLAVFLNQLSGALDTILVERELSKPKTDEVPIIGGIIG